MYKNTYIINYKQGEDTGSVYATFFFKASDKYLRKATIAFLEEFAYVDCSKPYSWEMEDAIGDGDEPNVVVGSKGIHIITYPYDDDKYACEDMTDQEILSAEHKSHMMFIKLGLNPNFWGEGASIKRYADTCFTEVAYEVKKKNKDKLSADKKKYDGLRETIISGNVYKFNSDFEYYIKIDKIKRKFAAGSIVNVTFNDDKDITGDTKWSVGDRVKVRFDCLQLA